MAGSVGVGGAGGASAFVSAGGVGAAGDGVSSCFTFFFARFAVFFLFLALGIFALHLEGIADSRYELLG